MLSYSPYDNLARKAYPAVLVTTSYNDSQVMYWEPAKYVAKLRTLKTDSNPLVSRRRCSRPATAARAAATTRSRTALFELAWMLKQVGSRSSDHPCVIRTLSRPQASSSNSCRSE